MPQFMRMISAIAIVIGISASGLMSAFAQSSSSQVWQTFEKIQTLKQDFFCPRDRYEITKAELKALAEADQSDRINGNDDMMVRDKDRRQSVALIAAEGCLLDGEDYYNAAIIFQHGIVSEHYIQAILYSRKAYDLGNPRGEALLPVAIDRYLMSRGVKQIFASQQSAPAYYKNVETEADREPCLWPVDDKVDIEAIYKIGGDEARLRLTNTITSMTSSFEVCDFPAKPVGNLLQSLLDLRI